MFITEDSFGAELPDNWQEIADSINSYLEGLWEDATEDERERFSDIVNDVWEDYCNHEGIECLPLNQDRIRKGNKEEEKMYKVMKLGYLQSQTSEIYRGSLEDCNEVADSEEELDPRCQCSVVEITDPDDVMR